MKTKLGLAVTLLTIAIASMQVWDASAEAPLIREPADVIIGDLDTSSSPATGSGVFVFPDAFSLRELFISDDDDMVNSTTIKWSYYHDPNDAALRPDSNFPAPGDTIEINGVASMTITDLSTGLGAATPPMGKEIQNDANNNDSGSAFEPVDGFAETVTFRNPDATNNGSGNVETLDVTDLMLFASDGSTFTEKTMTVYTVQNTTDSLTGNLSVLEPVKPTTDLRLAINQIWTEWDLGTTVPSFSGGATFTADSNLGLCLEVDGPGNNFVEWISPAEFFPLTKNDVYRVRYSVTTDQTAPNGNPIWYLVWTNPSVLGSGVVFGGEHWNFDLGGGGPAVDNVSTFDYYIAPNATGTQQWNGDLPGGNPDNDLGLFAPGQAGFAHAGLRFRVIDVANLDDANVPDTQLAEFRLAQLCLASVEISKVQLSAMKNDVAEPAIFDAVFDPTIFSVTQTTFPVGGGGTVSEVGATAIAGDGSSVVIDVPDTLGPRTTPDPSEANRVQVKYSVASEPNGHPTTFIRNPAKWFPIAWEAQTLYLIRTGLRNEFAGTVSGGGRDPVDVILMAYDTPLFEIGGNSFTTRLSPGFPLAQAASPRHTDDTGGVTQEYVHFFYSIETSFGDATFPVGNDTNTDPEDLALIASGVRSWAPFVDFFNTDRIGTSATDAAAAGGGPSGSDDTIMDWLIVDKLNTPSE